jgi:serine/threonine protein kinase/Tol biopolymer transport system component
MELKSGAKLGPYEILSRIGEGGMGQVWKARDTRLDRIVAIKTSAAKFTERFEGEARAVAALNHPHICTLYDVAPDYLVMEYVEGAEIKGPLPLDQALKYAIQLASALEAAHKKQITHRDLKPANILLTKAGVKVLDFGLAKIDKPEHPLPETNETLTRALTQEGSIVGTLQYMAPEQLQGQPVDTRADIFSFGCVLYEMLTGKRAFDGSNPASLIAAILERPAPKVGEIAPASLDWVLGRCLAKDRDERWQSARDVRAELERIAQTGAEIAASPPPAKSGRLPWFLAAAALAAAVATGFLYLRQPKPAPPQLTRLDLQAPDNVQFLRSLVLSPDGRMIAFTATGGGDLRARLWVRPLDSPEARPLAGTEGSNVNNFLLWSPDSRTLVFQSGSKLRKIDVTGGPVQSVCDLNAALMGGFITADQQIVFGTPAAGGIEECPASGGAARSITAFQPDGHETWHGFPSPLPDGRHFLFGRNAGPESGIYVASLDAKPGAQTNHRVLPEMIGALYVADPTAGSNPTHGHILFFREGTLMAQAFDAEKLQLTGEAIPLAENLETPYSFSASKDGKLAYLTANDKTQLTWVDRQGKTLGALGAVGRPFYAARISPDGARLAAAHGAFTANGDIWIMNLAQGSETRLTTDSANSPVWSPDGKWIAFSSGREGTTNLYVRATDGAGRDQLLLKTAEAKRPIDWSRDGKFLLFEVFSPKTAYDIWVLPMDAALANNGNAPNAAKPIPYLQSPADENGARFSPDGRFVAYASNESGGSAVYVRPFDPANPTASGSGAGKVKVSSGGGTAPFWRADGKELMYTTGRKVWSMDVTTTPAFHAGAPKLLFEGPPGVKAADPDAQRFLFDVPVGQTSAKVVLNWRAALKK